MLRDARNILKQAYKKDEQERYQPDRYAVEEVESTGKGIVRIAGRATLRTAKRGYRGAVERHQLLQAKQQQEQRQYVRQHENPYSSYGAGGIQREASPGQSTANFVHGRLPTSYAKDGTPRPNEKSISAVSQQGKSTMTKAHSQYIARKQARALARTASGHTSHLGVTATASVRRFGQAVLEAAKQAVQFVRSIIVAMSSLGGVVLMMAFAAAGLLLLSPFGILSAHENQDANVSRVRSIVLEVDTEFDRRLEDIKGAHPYDELDLQYIGSPDNVRINNWVDVIAVFSVKVALDPDNAMDVLTIDDEREGVIRSVFWDMNRIDYWEEVIENPLEDEEGEPTFYIILHITVTTRTAAEQASAYSFNADQAGVMDVLLTEFHPELKQMVRAPGEKVPPEIMEAIMDGLRSGGAGAEAVKLALTRLGDPYSIPLSGQGDYIDCSHLVQWAYAGAGVELPRTASPQGRYCTENGMIISKADLQPGDLVFWSYEISGSFMDIGHVGIYAGEGYVINASSVAMEVVLEPVFHSDKQVLYGRPCS